MNYLLISIILIIIIIIIYYSDIIFYIEKFENNNCPLYCNDTPFYMNIGSCKDCFKEGGKYEKTAEELNTLIVSPSPDHSPGCPGTCNNTSYKYGVCKKCFEEGGAFENTGLVCGDYCNKYSSRNGRCKLCFEEGGRLHNSNNILENRCPHWCKEDSYRYGLCNKCFIKNGKFSHVEKECPGSCDVFSNRYGICSTCFNDGKRLAYAKNSLPNDYIPISYTPIPRINIQTTPPDLSDNCPYYCVENSNINGGCKSCFEKDGYYSYLNRGICYSYKCNSLSDKNGICKSCFEEGGRFYSAPTPSSSPSSTPSSSSVSPDSLSSPPVSLSSTPTTPPPTLSPNCPYYCTKEYNCNGICKSCFEEDGALHPNTICPSICTENSDKNNCFCKPCFDVGRRLHESVDDDDLLNAYSTPAAPPCLSICQHPEYFSDTNNFNIHCKRPPEFTGQYCVEESSTSPISSTPTETSS